MPLRWLLLPASRYMSDARESALDFDLESSSFAAREYAPHRRTRIELDPGIVQERSSHQHYLAGSMKTASLVFLVFLLSGYNPDATAQIFHQDIDPDITINTWNCRDIYIDTTWTAVLPYGSPGSLTIWNDFGSQIDINAFSDCEVLFSGTYPAALTKDQLISTAGSWMQPNYSMLNSGTGNGNWIGVADGYLGVRIKHGSQWFYGWIRLDVNAAGTSVTIKEYACNRTAGSPINAGQTTLSAIHDPVEFETISVSVFPNPFTTSAMMQLSGFNGTAVVRIFDVFGREVFSWRCAGDGLQRMERSGLPAGMYFLETSTNSTRIATGKFIIRD
jgi:hypothetical protein